MTMEQSVIEESKVEQPSPQSDVIASEIEPPQFIIPEISKPESPKPKDTYSGHVELHAKGEFIEGVADLVATGKSNLDLDRTQKMFIKQGYYTYVFSRTAIKES